MRSQEWRDRQSAAQKGKPKPPRTDAHRAALAAANKGHAPSPQTIAAVVAANTGKRHTEEFRAARRGNRYVVDAPVLGECVYCFGPAQTRDHVIPLTRGGSDTADNVVLCCFTCNRSKNNRTPEEWIEGVSRWKL